MDVEVQKKERKSSFISPSEGGIQKRQNRTKITISLLALLQSLTVFSAALMPISGNDTGYNSFRFNRMWCVLFDGFGFWFAI